MPRTPRLRDAVERRTGLVSWLRGAGREFRVPAETGRPLSLGSMLLCGLLLQIATGILLLVHFVPDPAGAFESVRALMRDVPYGWLVRLAHVHGANWMVAILFVHLFHTAFRGAYKDPREAVWWSGCMLFLLVMAAALTGYVLPWSQTSYWATTVVTASLSYLPWVGPEATAWLRGGQRVGDATYRRAFAAHVALLPLVLVALAALHLAWVRRVGLAGRPRRRGDPGGTAQVAFAPRVALRALLSATAFAMLVVASLCLAPDLFFPAGHLQPADPFETPLALKPEWYFLWLYALPRWLPEPGVLLVQGGALLGLFALPLLDRSPGRHPLDRPLVTVALVFALIALVGLSVLGARV